MKRSTPIIPLIDIAANLVDVMYQGVYNGKEKHRPDLEEVFKRSWENGVEKILITGCNLEESKKAVELAKQHAQLSCTVGCHPTNCSEFEKSGDDTNYLQSLVDICQSNISKVAAVGEFGLDYDRIHFCPAETQKKYFQEQLRAFAPLKLPLFLHCRNSAEDLLNILSNNRDCFTKGVLHSFDGTLQEAQGFIDIGLSIGLNGCSLKTEDNLEVVKELPADKILIETDCPWCEIRPTHAGYKYIKTTFPSAKKEKWECNKMVKGRNEPSNLIQVLEVIAGVKDEDIIELSKTIYRNTEDLFFNSS